MAAAMMPPTGAPRPLQRPRFEGAPYRPRFQRSPFPPNSRFRPPGYSGQIMDGRAPRPWTEHRPGYTPINNYNQGNKAKKSSHRKTVDYNSTVLKTLQVTPEACYFSICV
ncbi:hypothetical protein EB796_017580 [Bugula neritina]|uniref:Uncharacterized protein n=1 Tax=Bugula neritina TaxID=10212 RepID=A0A7J7JD27_BUGNE|nr:hypothetical protein EB796_017580 [Bugula neritina]